MKNLRKISPKRAKKILKNYQIQITNYRNQLTEETKKTTYWVKESGMWLNSWIKLDKLKNRLLIINIIQSIYIIILTILYMI